MTSSRPAEDAVSVTRVGSSDRDEVCALRPRPSQASFVASNEDSLLQADDDAACVPLVIRAADRTVGFAMYALDRDDGNYWIYRLMIDARFQGRGYGSRALRRIVAMLAALPGCACVMLGVHPANGSARHFYRRAGFQETGLVIGGEIVLKYPL